MTLERRTATLAGMTRMIAITALAMTGLVMTGLAAGCVNVTAPDKPIQINLNVTITQDVVVKLDTQAKSLIQQNPGIF